MNPDASNIDTSMGVSTIMGVNIDPTHFLWSTVLTLMLSHLGANYLKEITPRGYMFWFTILNLILGFLLL